MIPDSSRQAGTFETYQGRGVFVPHGLTARAIVEGGRALLRECPDAEIGPYTARNMATAVLLEALKPGPERDDVFAEVDQAGREFA